MDRHPRSCPTHQSRGWGGNALRWRRRQIATGLLALVCLGVPFGATGWSEHIHLAAGGVERVVALVGNLHTIRKIQWAKEAGRPLPYLAERLIHADITVTSIMQDFDAACDHLRHPAFYTTAHRQGLEAVSRYLNVVNHQPRMEMRHVSDGIMIWRCRE